MRKPRYIWAGLLLAAAVVLLLIARPSEPWRHTPDGKPDPLAMVQDVIAREYIEEVDLSQLQRRAIEAMVAQLDDPYTQYIPPEQAKRVSARVAGSVTGTGLVTERTGLVKGPRVVLIRGAMPDSPASEADLIGRVLLTVDSTDVATMSDTELARALSPPAGDEVELLLDAGDSDGQLVTLRSDTFPVDTASGLYRNAKGAYITRVSEGLSPAITGISPGVHVIRISEFCPETPDELATLLEQTEGLEGLVLDLRCNPGGGLTEGVEVCDLFMDSGTIVTVEDRDGETKRYSAHKTGPYGLLPIVVLIDEETASAAELVAGALQSRGRAVIVGAPSIGKGSVQTLHTLPNDMGLLNLTTSRFYVDPEHRIQRTEQHRGGIAPDLSMATDAKEREQFRRARRWSKLPATPLSTSQPTGRTYPRCDQDAMLIRSARLLSQPRQWQRMIDQATQKRNRSRREP